MFCLPSPPRADQRPLVVVGRPSSVCHLLPPPLAFAGANRCSCVGITEAFKADSFDKKINLGSFQLAWARPTPCGRRNS